MTDVLASTSEVPACTISHPHLQLSTQRSVRESIVDSLHGSDQSRTTRCNRSPLHYDNESDSSIKPNSKVKRGWRSNRGKSTDKGCHVS